MLRVTTSMKSFRRRHPLICVLLMFFSIPAIIVFVGFSLSGLVILSSNCQPSSSESCDGVGLLALSLWTLSVSLASVLIGVAVIVTIIVLVAALLAYMSANLKLKKP